MPKIETDTNQVYRKKYFVPADSIIGPHPPAKGHRPVSYNPVIEAKRVVVSNQPVRLSYNDTGAGEDIRVEVVKSGNQIKGLKINCPCGRHTELDVAYGPTSN
ncbi:MAG: hypothetical protein V2A34_07200 [Lentisphaerota bacterium]